MTMAGGSGRPVPSDFESTFVMIGRFDCEARYSARRDTITRWLIELGKERLIKARASYVAEQRAKGEWMTRQTRLVESRLVKPKPQPQPQQVCSPRHEELNAIARDAAHFLRTHRYGGWRVSPTGDGEWFVGTVRKTSDQLIAMAERMGFDASLAEKGARFEAHSIHLNGDRNAP